MEEVETASEDSLLRRVYEHLERNSSDSVGNQCLRREGL